MSRALAALAARYVGRRVRLRRPPDTGTITRVTAHGFMVTTGPHTADDIAEWLDA